MTRTRRMVAAVALVLGVLAVSSTSALAQPSGRRASTGAPTPDLCGPPGVLPGIFRCESQTTPTDGDYYYNLDFINKFRARFPDTTLDNNQIAQWGHWVCTYLETRGESAVVQGWVNSGWGWDGANWVVATSKNFYCPALR